jgi:hypothetical protein
MKKSLKYYGKLYAAIALITVFAACTKNSVDSSTNELDYTTSINASRTTSEVIQKYGLLKPAERQKLWEQKINAILKNDNQKLNNKQLEAVKELKTILATVGVEKLSKDEALNDKMLSEFRAKYQNSFTNKQFYYLVVSPYGNNAFSISNIESMKLPGKGSLSTKNVTGDTQLDIEEDPIDNIGDGLTCTCRSDWYCLTSSCDWGDCNITSSGCGLTGGSRCKGRCDSPSGH